MYDDSEDLAKSGREMPDVGNFYGGLIVSARGDRFYWGIENWDGTRFWEIPKYLYDALCKHDDEQRNPVKKTITP